MLNSLKHIHILVKRAGSLLCLLLLVFPFVSKAQQVKVSADIDVTPRVQIGDQFHVSIQVQHSKNTKVAWPLIPDTLGKIERLDSLHRDTMPQQDGSVIERCKFTVTVFDTGKHAVPPFVFKLVNGDSLLTEAIMLEVFAPKVDTTQAIRDIKGPLGIPYTFKELLPYIAGAVFIIAAVLFTIYYIRKRRQNQPLFVPKIPAKPAHEVAMQMLQDLESQKLWQQGKIKAYHSELTDIIRSYIEESFHIPALEQPSEDTITNFRSIEIEDTLKQKLAQMLRLSDMVKFAKAQPIAPENELSLQNAYEFVRATTPLAKTEEISNDKTE